jgi:hypothetical protein
LRSKAHVSRPSWVWTSQPPSVPSYDFFIKGLQTRVKLTCIAPSLQWIIGDVFLRKCAYLPADPPPPMRVTLADVLRFSIKSTPFMILEGTLLDLLPLRPKSGHYAQSKHSSGRASQEEVFASRARASLIKRGSVHSPFVAHFFWNVSVPLDLVVALSLSHSFLFRLASCFSRCSPGVDRSRCFTSAFDGLHGKRSVRSLGRKSSRESHQPWPARCKFSSLSSGARSGERIVQDNT